MLSCAQISISIIIWPVSGRSSICRAGFDCICHNLNGAARLLRFIAVTFNLPLTERCHLSWLSLWNSLIWSEKSLPVRLDYSAIINHIQTHENKFCLHVLRGRGARRQRWRLGGEPCICITLGWDKRAENDLFTAAPFIFYSNYLPWIIQSGSFDRLRCSALINSRQRLLATVLRGVLIERMQTISCSAAPKAARVNLLYHTSNRGQFSLPLFFLFFFFLFCLCVCLHLQICGDESNVKF